MKGVDDCLMNCFADTPTLICPSKSYSMNTMNVSLSARNSLIKYAEFSEWLGLGYDLFSATLVLLSFDWGENMDFVFSTAKRSWIYTNTSLQYVTTCAYSICDLGHTYNDVELAAFTYWNFCENVTASEAVGNSGPGRLANALELDSSTVR